MATATDKRQTNVQYTGHFGLRASGDSLKGDLIIPGDILEFSEDFTFEDGSIYAVRVGSEMLVRHVTRTGEAVYRLSASNEGYKDLTIGGDNEDGEILAKLARVTRCYES